MKFLCTILTALLASNLNAQQQTKTVRIDTINIHGRLISTDGTKMSGIPIRTKSPSRTYIGTEVLWGFTDSVGNFSINGVNFTDTLSFYALSQHHTFINNGSRFITLTISPKIFQTNPNIDLPAIKVKRTHKRKPAKFKLVVDDNFYCGFVLDKIAEYPRGFATFYKNINAKLIYPQAAIKNNIEGKVTVQFTVERDGTLVNPEIINGLGYGCDEAAINAITKTGRWIPGIQNGRPTKTKFLTDIIFKLED